MLALRFEHAPERIEIVTRDERSIRRQAVHQLR